MRFRLTGCLVIDDTMGYGSFREWLTGGLEGALTWLRFVEETGTGGWAVLLDLSTIYGSSI